MPISEIPRELHRHFGSRRGIGGLAALLLHQNLWHPNFIKLGWRAAIRPSLRDGRK